ncbi:hypothetical protein [Microcystis viridis]|uniref:hypothetical protein n=1 Tax=Microcystis viridis TaxID=44822 RepID=UPI0018D533FB|nr:hypothetical protein [Microcystis viridis]
MSVGALIEFYFKLIICITIPEEPNLMPDFQTFIGILSTLFVFLTGIILNYDSIQLGNEQIIIPQWFGLLFAGITLALRFVLCNVQGYKE